MKVVQLSSVHHVFDNRIFNKISKSLVNNGYDVDLLIQHTKNEVVEGVNIIALPKVSGKLGRPLKVIPTLFKKAIEYPPKTIFHFHDPELIPVGLLLRIFGYKVIYDVHEDVPKDVLTKEWMPESVRNFISRVIDKIEIVVSKKLDGIVTVVPSITSRFKESNVIEIRNYPLISLVNEQKESLIRSNYVVYIGSLTERRGLTEMVDGIELVRYEEIRFCIGGLFVDDGLKNSLEKRRGWERVDYIGWVKKNSLIQRMEGAIAGLLTLRNIPSHVDSLPVKMFEYMLAGIPIIASNFKFWESIIINEKCGLTVDPSNPEAIALAIDWLYENPEKAKEMGENGKKAVLGKYNWMSQENKLITLYRSLSC